MVWIHTESGSLVESKIVPAVIEVRWWQRLHYCGFRLVNWQHRSWAQ